MNWVWVKTQDQTEISGDSWYQPLQKIGAPVSHSSHPPEKTYKHHLNGPNCVEIHNQKPWFRTGV